MSNTVTGYTYYNGYINITLSDGSQVVKPLSWFCECPDVSEPEGAMYSLRYSPRPCRKRIEDKLNMESYYMEQHEKQLRLSEYERNQHYGFQATEY